MRRFVAEEEEESEINITPMLDVVFIMLIFFIVTASFVKEDGLDVTKPDTPPQNIQNEKKKNVLIDIRSAGRININGRSVDIRAVAPNVVRLKAENPEAKVVIRAADDARNGDVVQVMNASREAGVYDISFAD
ncbi:MAG: biopolymer transporter ExbD [Pseudomonadota bacterium]